MPVILGLAALVLLGLFLFARHRALREYQGPAPVHFRAAPLPRGLSERSDREPESPLARIRDPRLGAAVLMIQLVRTGSPVTAQEKTCILEQMEEKLKIADVSGLFTHAWTYTAPRAFFSNVADELTPMLRERLDAGERLQLVDMLTEVANAYGEASDLQLEAIARLKRRLTRA